MKKIIQISVLFVAILIGAGWAIFRPAIHGFLRLPGPNIASETERTQETNSSRKVVAQNAILPDKSEAIDAPPVEKTVDVVPESTSKMDLTKVKSNPASKLDAKVVSTTPDSETTAPVPAPPPNSADAMKNQEEEIQRIVMERYPDITKGAFPDEYPDLSKLPKSVFPDRIQIRQEINFELLQDGKVVGVSFVKADGYVRPRRIEGEELIVSSLSDNEMRATMPLAETNFASIVEANYQVALERANLRLEKMRDAGKTEISKNPTLYQNLAEEGMVWHDKEDQRFDAVKESAEELLAGRPFEPVAFYANGLVMMEGEGNYSGGYFVVIVLLEGTDSGFGPYRWRAKCLLRDGQVVGWLGMPKIESSANS